MKLFILPIVFLLTVSTSSQNYLDDYNSEDIIDPFFWDEMDGRNITDTVYMLWTRSNPSDYDYYILEWKDVDSLANSPFNGSKKTYFNYHGFGSVGVTPWIIEAKTELLIYEDCNVFSVDYANVSVYPFYAEGIANMYLVANRTSSLIEWLIDMTQLTLSQVHITGQSLGAQAAGMTGQYMTSGNVARVTGLDPAGPGFDNITDEFRLSKNDAEFVDVIHTNGGNLTEGCYGIYEPCGHVDFYPNGGKHQPGCQPDMDLITDCSHARVKDLWIESILGASFNGSELMFTSWPCESEEDVSAGECSDCEQGCLDMGFHVERNLEGSYYLRTNKNSPFAQGEV